MHSWHAGSNALMVEKLGVIGLPIILLAGIIHETPLDLGSFQAEQIAQGTVNHILDSTMDFAANIFGTIAGVVLPDSISVDSAIMAGDYIPGPGDNDPHGKGLGHYNGKPSDKWWH